MSLPYTTSTAARWRQGWHLTESSVPLYEQTSLFRIYDNTVMPGLFTTAEYAAALFRWWQAFMGLG